MTILATHQCLDRAIALLRARRFVFLGELFLLFLFLFNFSFSFFSFVNTLATQQDSQVSNLAQ
jgi:hypothetical protein